MDGLMMYCKYLLLKTCPLRLADCVNECTRFEYVTGFMVRKQQAGLVHLRNAWVEKTKSFNKCRMHFQKHSGVFPKQHILLKVER